MIGLRVIEVLDHLRVSAAASSAINIMRWLRDNQHDGLLISGPGEREQDVENEGLAFRRYRQGGTGWWFGGRRRLVQQIDDWKPDLIHIHQMACLGIFLGIAGKLQLPLVVSLQRLPSNDEAELLRDPQVALIIVPSESCRAQLISRMGFDRDRVVMLPYGLDLKRFPEAPPPESIQHVAAIGRFEQPFGFEVLVEALALLRNQGITLSATLVGNGDGAGRLMEFIDHHRLSQHISIIPGTSQTGKILAGVDLFVYPGKEDLLTLGVLKAMACARPVIASAVGSMTEWVHEGENGLLVPPGDALALAQAMARLHADPQCAQKMGLQARSMVVEKHDITIIGKALHECYRAALRSDTTPVGTEIIRAYRRLTHPDDESGQHPRSEA